MWLENYELEQAEILDEVHYVNIFSKIDFFMIFLVIQERLMNNIEEDDYNEIYSPFVLVLFAVWACKCGEFISLGATSKSS